MDWFKIQEKQTGRHREQTEGWLGGREVGGLGEKREGVKMHQVIVREQSQGGEAQWLQSTTLQ